MLTYVTNLKTMKTSWFHINPYHMLLKLLHLVDMCDKTKHTSPDMPIKSNQSNQINQYKINKIYKSYKSIEYIESCGHVFSMLSYFSVFMNICVWKTCCSVWSKDRVKYVKFTWFTCIGQLTWSKATHGTLPHHQWVIGQAELSASALHIRGMAQSLSKITSSQWIWCCEDSPLAYHRWGKPIPGASTRLCNLGWALIRYSDSPHPGASSCGSARWALACLFCHVQLSLFMISWWISLGLGWSRVVWTGFTMMESPQSVQIFCNITYFRFKNSLDWSVKWWISMDWPVKIVVNVVTFEKKVLQLLHVIFPNQFPGLASELVNF